VSGKRGSDHVPEPDGPLNAVFTNRTCFEILLPTLVELSTVEQEVSAFQKRIHIVTYDLEEIHQITVKIVQNFNPARRLIQEKGGRTCKNLNIASMRWNQR
jgi:hypothetical protein